MDDIRVGVIGFGFMGRMHTYGYKTIPLYYSGLPFRVKLAGICDVDEKAAGYAKEALDFAMHAGRKTIKAEDIEIASKKVMGK